MQDVIEGMAIAFSLLIIFGTVAAFILFMWTIGRKERRVIEEYSQANKERDDE